MQFIQLSWSSLLFALLLTEISELIVALFILRAVPVKRRLLTVLFMNLLTNPLLNIVLVAVVSVVAEPTIAYGIVLAFGEFVVWFVEAMIMRSVFKIDWPEALLSSFILNAVSLLVGLVSWLL